MLKPQFILPLATELVIDLFAGGGGASTGIEQAIGRHVDIAVNHDPAAVSLHQANHPQTKHFVSDVFEVDPLAVTGGQSVGLLWASPDCKHFSKAKGGKPVSKKIRGLAWVVVKWAKLVRPRIICLENVEEFQTWGPLADDGRPCPQRKGSTFKRWKAQLENLGYRVEHRELRACDYGTPTIRKRLFLVARCDGQPIVWPQATHGAGLKPYRTAAECIDWSLPCPSIFNRARPLADATMRRVAAGVMRYVVNSAKPFIVPIQNYGWADRVYDINQPLRTVTAQPKGGAFALVSACLAKHYGGVVGSSLAEPIGTVTSIDHHSLVRALLTKFYGTGEGQEMGEPLHTVTTKDRFGLVTVHGELYAIADIGMRMLQPRELYRAQGFPESYVIDRGADGRALSKADQVRMCGNSVCPPLARAIVEANYSDAAVWREAA